MSNHLGVSPSLLPLGKRIASFALNRVTDPSLFTAQSRSRAITGLVLPITASFRA